MSNLATLIMSGLGATHLLSFTVGKRNPSHTKTGPGRRRALSRLEAAFNLSEKLADRLQKARYGTRPPRWCVCRVAAGAHEDLVRDGYTLDNLREEYVNYSNDLQVELASAATPTPV